MEVNNKYIRFDWAVKRMLRDKANFSVLEGLITVLLGERITLLELIHDNSDSLNNIDRLYKLRLCGKDVEGSNVIIEIRILRYLYYLMRIVFKKRGMMSKMVLRDNTYDNVKKVYSINILYFDLGKGSDYLYHGKTVFTGVHTGDRLEVNTREADEIKMSVPEDVFPEYYIIRVNEFNDVATTPLEEWLDYLKNNRISDTTTAPGLQEARAKLLYMTMTDKERRAYDEHIDDIMVQNDVLDTAKMEGRAEGLAEGRATGKAEAMKLMVGNMLAKGMSVDTISDITGLPVAKVREIQQQ